MTKKNKGTSIVCLFILPAVLTFCGKSDDQSKKDEKKTELAMTLQLGKPTLGQSSRTGESRSPCPYSDGRQTLNIEGGGTYTGEFRNCTPQAGDAVVTLQGQTYTGIAQSDGSDCVRFMIGNMGSLRICRIVEFVN